MSQVPSPKSQVPSPKSQVPSPKSQVRLNNARFFAVSCSVLALLLASGCASMTSRDMLKKEKELAYRGYIDVGAGYAVIPTGAPNAQDIGGFTATIKAYPLGRWYAPLKGVTQVEEKQALIKNALLQADDRRVKQAALEVAQKDLQTANADVSANKDQNVKAASDKLKATQAALDKLEKDPTIDQTLQSMVSSGELYQFEKDHPCRSKDKDDDNQDDQVKQKKKCTALRWIKPYAHRTFFFYGRSIGGYGSAINGEVNSVGVGYDITPEFGLIVGKAWYDVNMPIAATATTPASSKTDTKDAIMFGVQVNLSAFKLFRGLAEVK